MNVIVEVERSEEEAHYLEECELALLIGILNSDGSGQLTEYLTSALFIDIWKPEEIQNTLM